MELKFNKDDTVTLDGEGEYRVIRCMPNQYTRYEIEDVTPDDEEPTWHQKDGGGAYTTKFINGYYGVTEIAHRDRLKLLT